MSINSKEIYLKYFRLGEGSYREKVRFYEENPDAISSLHFEEKVDVDIDYVICLFEVGRYERYLQKVDAIIETVVIENIFTFKGEDVFETLLIRKAACLYQLKKLNKALDILSQLIKMSPNHHVAISLYTICKRRQPNDVSMTIKAIGIASLLLVVSISIARILLIEPFFDQYLSPFLALRNTLVVFAISCFLFNEIFLSYAMHKETGRYAYPIFNKIFKPKNSN